jgi:multicomponent Na+:H+ antiporter subunit G
MKMLLVSLVMLSGLFFFMVGTIGILRFPDIFTRAHCAAKCDTLGVVLCLLSLIIFNGFNLVSLKIILIVVFVWVTNPVATHLIAKAEYNRKNSVKGIDEVKGFENI